MVLLVVFGAGASYDSVPRSETARLERDAMPPLATGLFASSPYTREVLGHYPSARPVVAHMRTTLAEGGDVERELRALLEEADTYPDRHVHLMAVRYYLRDLVDGAAARVTAATAGVTNYAALVDHLRRWAARHNERVALVTFDYDTLLEQALADSFRRPFESLGDYVRGDWPVYKPHGSVDWVQRVEWAGPGQPPPGALDTLDVRWHARSLRAAAAFLHAREVQPVEPRVGWAPGLAIPLAEKSEFACPRQHLDHLAERLPEVDRLLVVGWRARERHFQEWLGRVRAGVRALVVAESVQAAYETVDNLGYAHTEIVPDGFSGLLASARFADFLR